MPLCVPTSGPGMGRTMLFMTIICLNVLIHCNVGKSLGKPSCKKSEVFLNIVQKAFDPPPLLFEHLSGGVF